MQLTPQGQQVISDIARRYQVSEDAVLSMFQSVINGNGTMAQFNHPEFGGMGQWMQGGMTMVSDLFNHSLKMQVDNVCGELSQLLATRNDIIRPQERSKSDGSGGQWWPAEFGSPTASGSQNNTRYAWFANHRRLVLNDNGQISVYDTQDHHIGGVSQQQGYGASVLFTSQYGVVDVLNLPLISGTGTLNSTSSANNPPNNAPQQPSQSQFQSSQPQSPQPQNNQDSQAGTATPSDIFANIERLNELHRQGILSEEEFTSKKAELLSRL